MVDEQLKKKVFSSVEEVIKEYLPESFRKETMDNIIEPYALGVLLAKTDVKNVKKLVERNY